MEKGFYPFVPSLNKLVSGRTDTEWENYFKMWSLKCDAMLLTKTFRGHEKLWAIENKIPICNTVDEVLNIKLPPFAELGRRFGEAVALKLDPKEDWRRYNKEETIKNFNNLCGLGAMPLDIGVCALQAWDRQTNG